MNKKGHHFCSVNGVNLVTVLLGQWEMPILKMTVLENAGTANAGSGKFQF